MTTIRVELELRDGSFTTGMLRSGQSISSFNEELRRTDPHFRKLSDNSKRVVKSIRRADVVTRDFLSTLRDISIVSGGISLAFNTITGASNSLVGSIIRTNAEIQRLQFQMMGMSTSARPIEEAAASVAYLQDQALKSPFTLQEMSNSFVKLRAAGIDPTNGSLEALKDGIAAFGGTDDHLHRVTLGITQMAGKGVIQMEEMRQQLGESMPSAMRLMARSMGVSVAELTDAISTGRVESQAALAAFFAELQRTYGGTSQRMMETFSGQVSKLKTNFQLLAQGDGMSDFFEEIQSGLKELNDFLQSNQAKGFARDIGNALTAVTRAIRIASKTAYEFREEIALIAKVVAGGIVFSMLSRGAVRAASSIRLLSLAVSTLGSNLSQSGRSFNLANSMMRRSGVSARSTALAFGGMRLAVGGIGRAVSVVAPWIGILISVLGLAASKMGLFGDNTEEAMERLKKYGAESKAQAKEILDARQAELEEEVYKRSRKGVRFFGRTAEIRREKKNRFIAEAQNELDSFLRDRQSIERSLTEEETQKNIRAYRLELDEKTREFNRNYNTRQIALTEQRDLEISNAKETGEEVFKIRRRYQDQTLENQKRRSEEIIAVIDKERARLTESLKVAESEDEKSGVKSLIAFLEKRRVQAAEELGNLGNFGITFVDDVENSEKKVKRGNKLLDSVSAKVKGLQAELVGSGGAFAKLQFQISRGDFGSIEEGGEAVERLHEGLREAVAQKEALDKLMKGDREANSDIDGIYERALQERLDIEAELKGRNRNEADQFLFGLESGFYDGLGPLENIRSDIAKIGVTFRENTFGQGTVSQINTVNKALKGILETVTDIGGKTTGVNFSGLSAPSGTNSGNRAMLDLIASVEANARGYNSTLDNGRWTGGEQNLTAMTLKEVLALQKKMLSFDENRSMYGEGRGSSALGRYQIVSTTLKSLIKEMGLSGDELFDEKMQDKMAMHLLKRRGGSLTGLRNEWAGLKNISDEKILAALTSVPGFPGSESLVSNRMQQTSVLEDKGRRARELLEENRLKSEELERKKALDKLLAERGGANLQADGSGQNLASIREQIQTGQLGENRNADAEIYKELLKAAMELDKVEKERDERRKARRQSEDQLKALEVERLGITQRIADEQARTKNPNYIAQSSDLKRLIEDLDKYVQRVGKAAGKDSEAYKAAKAYREELITLQRNLDASIIVREMSEETRDVSDALLSQSNLRKVQLSRDLDLVDQRANALRQAGMSEVEITRVVEEQKAAIRRKYMLEDNPIAAQMEEWKGYAENLKQDAGQWGNNLIGGAVSALRGRGTGQLASALNSVVDNMLTNGLKFAFSSIFGDFASKTGANIGGAKGAGKAGKAGKAGTAVPVRHSGGMADFRGSKRLISPTAFNGAPKFHTGGIVGAPRLKKDEVPIIAKKKEGVFTEQQMKALAPVGSGSVAMSVSAPITINGSSGTPEQNQDLAKRMGTEMTKTMRGVVVDEIRRQMRPGNMLSGVKGM